MADDQYDAATAVADTTELAVRVESPVSSTMPRGLLSAVTVMDVSEPIRWGLSGARYDRFTGFDIADTGFGIRKEDPSDLCPMSDAIGDADSLAHARASAYAAFTRINCTEFGSAHDYVGDQFAAREERLLELILDDIVDDVSAATSVGTDVAAGLGTLEAAFLDLWAGQGTLWMTPAIAAAANAGGALVDRAGTLSTISGHRVAISAAFTFPAAFTPNLTIYRSPLTMSDLFDRETNMRDAYASRQYLFVTDPAADVVVAAFS